MEKNNQPEFRIVQTINHDDILAWMRALRLKAYVAGSGFKVAAVIAMKRNVDYLLTGAVNVECIDHRHGTHGESSAISAIATALGKKAKVDEVWILGAPAHLIGPCDNPLADMPGFSCGDCRQHISEIARRRDIPVHSCSLNGHSKTRRLDELLPDSFTFSHINPDLKSGKPPLYASGNDPDLDAICYRVVRHEPQSLGNIFEWLSSLESIDYASGLHQAVILRLSNGAYVAGVKVENAAYVGLSAMQSVLGNAVTTFGDMEVREIFTFSRGEKMDDPDLVYPLPLSALQSLAEFIRDNGDDISVTMFSNDGNAMTITLKETAALTTTFATPAYHIRNGKFEAA